MTCSPMLFVFGAGAEVDAGVSVVVPMLLALHRNKFVSHRARIERQPVNVADRPQARRQFRFDVEFEQRGHLAVAVLLDYICALVPLNKIVHLARERIRPYPEIIRFYAMLVRQLIPRLDDCPVRGSISQDANLGIAPSCQLGAWNKRPRGLKLLVKALHVAFKIIGTLAILRFLVVSAAAREVCGGGMIGAGQRTIADAISIDIFVARKPASLGNV